MRSVTFALLGTFVLRIASYGAGVIIPVFLGVSSRHESSLTAGVASLVAVCFYVSELVGAPIFGALSDRFGRWPFLVLGPVFGGIAIQLLGFTSIIPILVLVRVLEGLSTASSAPATLGLLSAQTSTSDRLRGRVMGFYEAATVVGIAAGGALGGTLFDLFHGLAFTFIAIVYASALVLFALVRRDHTPRAARPPRGNVLRQVLNRRIMRFAPAWLAANAVLGAWFSLGPFLAAGTPDPQQVLMGGFSAHRIGMAFLLFGVVFTIGTIVWGYVMPWAGRQNTLLSGVLGLAFTTVVLWMFNQATAVRPHILDSALIGFVILGVLIESGFTPAALAYLAEIAEEHGENRGAVMGVYSVLLSVGQLTGGALAAPFAQRMGVNGLIVLTGLLCVIAAFTVILLGYSERRTLRRKSTPREPSASTAADQQPASSAV
jgi:MFS family permease